MRGEKDGPKYDNTGLLAHNMQNSGHSIRERVVLFGIEAGGFFFTIYWLKIAVAHQIWADLRPKFNRENMEITFDT